RSDASPLPGEAAERAAAGGAAAPLWGEAAERAAAGRAAAPLWGEAAHRAAAGGAIRALIQRVREARVTVGGRTTGEIGAGLLVLAAVATDDTADDRDWLARKIVSLRVFDDE